MAVNGQPDCPQPERAGRRSVDTAQLNVWTRIDRARPRQFPGNRAGKQRRYQRAIPSSVKDGRKRQIIAQEAFAELVGRAHSWKLDMEKKGRCRAASSTASLARRADHIAQGALDRH